MDLFENYNWTNIHIVRVVAVNANASERMLLTKVNLYEYQLAVKFYGHTEINFNDKPLLFDTGTVLYLPKCDDPKITYSKYIREDGTGVCIYFTSENPLPPEAMTIKEASVPLELFTRVYKAWQTIGGELSCLGAFYTLLGELCRVVRDKIPQSSALDYRLSEAKAYLDVHAYELYLDINYLASVYGLSPEYFRQCFQKKWGITPLKYICVLKMTRARELLSKTKLPICEVAELCGFSNSNYFIRFFRRHEGMTPGEFRMLYAIMNRNCCENQ